MREDEWFEVPDLIEFTDKVRAIVYNNFGEWNDKSEEVILTNVKENELKDLEERKELKKMLAEANLKASQMNEGKIAGSLDD